MQDLFFHYDDMKKTGLSRQFLKEARDKFIVRFRFRVMPYHGKYKQSKKVVDIELINIEPLTSGPLQAKQLQNPEASQDKSDHASQEDDLNIPDLQQQFEENFEEDFDRRLNLNDQENPDQSD
jgi:hypothetical protein